MDRYYGGNYYVLFVNSSLILFYILFSALLSAFTVPYFYEQHDDEVDKFVEHAREACGQYKGLVLAKLPGSVKKYLHH